MYDLVELESQWQIYNLRRKNIYILIIIIAVVIFVCISAIVYLAQDDQEQQSEQAIKVALNQNIKEQNQTDSKNTLKKNIIDLSLPSISFDAKKETNVSNEIYLQTSTDINVIDMILKKYAEKKDYKNTMELAQAYFNAKKFQEAKYYAIEANNIDSSKDGGWIVFAKASVALGAKADAINALARFNQSGGSTASKELEKELKEQ